MKSDLFFTEPKIEVDKSPDFEYCRECYMTLSQLYTEMINLQYIGINYWNFNEQNIMIANFDYIFLEDIFFYLTDYKLAKKLLFIDFHNYRKICRKMKYKLDSLEKLFFVF